jgi:hypothetical protein
VALRGVDFRTFIYAGVLSMSVLFTAIFPGRIYCAFQEIVILCPAGLAGVHRDPILILTVIAELPLLIFTLIAFGVMTAARTGRVTRHRRGDGRRTAGDGDRGVPAHRVSPRR